jgi:hypothetical protein
MKVVPLLLLTLFASFAAQAGVWGAGSFENDYALDWAAQCAHSTDIGAVTRAFDGVLKSERIEAPEGSAAVVAAEIVAAALGKPSANLPKELRAWIQRQPQDKLSQLAPLAKKALVRIQDAKVSELQQLWSESKQNKWPAAIAELSGRLDGHLGT